MNCKHDKDLIAIHRSTSDEDGFERIEVLKWCRECGSLWQPSWNMDTHSRIWTWNVPFNMQKGEYLSKQEGGAYRFGSFKRMVTEVE